MKRPRRLAVCGIVYAHRVALAREGGELTADLVVHQPEMPAHLIKRAARMRRDIREELRLSRVCDAYEGNGVGGLPPAAQRRTGSVGQGPFFRCWSRWQ